MAMANKTKQRTRALQERTGWSYQECLRCIREMTPEAIEVLVNMRKAPPHTKEPTDA